MMSRFAMVILFLLSFTLCHAQSGDDVKKQINDVKKKTSVYLYGEATAETEQDARNMAEEFLYNAINKWAAGKKKLQGAENLLINNKQDCVSALTSKRGTLYRCLVYVKKSDIQKAGNVDIIENKSAVPAAIVEETAVYPDLVREVAGISEYSKLDERLKRAVQSGEVADYASNSFPTRPEDYYFVIYNQSGNIVAMLSPGVTRTNIRTGEADSLTNYKGNKAIGFKLK